MTCEPTSDSIKSQKIILWILPVFTFLMLVGAIIPMPVQVPADGHEYLGTVASLIATHNLTFEREDMLESARLVSPETFVVDGEFGMNTQINPLNGKRMWGLHSVYTAFVALPFVLLFGAKGFLVLNALCFALMMYFLYCHFCDHNGPVVALGLAVFCLVLSGAPNYVFWINSETLMMAMIFGALYYGLRFQMYRAMVFLGIASAIKMPLIILFPLFALWHLINYRSLRVILIMTVIYISTLAPHTLYELIELGRFGLIPVQRPLSGPVSISGEFSTWLRMWTFWVGAGTGIIWFYPALFWCLYRTRFPWWMTAATATIAVIISIACMSPINYISTGAGIRYNTLVFPLFLFLGGRWRSGRLDWILMAVAAFLGGPLIMDAIQNTRTPEGVFNRAYPSMIPAQQWGTPLYPELLFHVGCRLPRGAVSDYLDNQLYVRNHTVQVMIREAEPGEAIVAMLPVAEAPPHTVRYGHVYGPKQTKEIRGGQMSVVTIPMTSEDFVEVGYQEWQGRQKRTGATARLRFDFSQMDLASNNAQLHWQVRYHGGISKFLHQVGPRLLNVFPSRQWILRTVSVEALEDNLDQPADTLLTSVPSDGVSIQWDTDDKVEGSAAVAITIPENMKGMSTEIFTADFIDLGQPFKKDLCELEVGGFLQLGALRRHLPAPKGLAVGVFVDSFNASGALLQRAWIARLEGNPSTSWQYFNEKASLPKGSVSARVEVLVENGVGTFKIDGLMISWYQTPWQ